MKGATVLIIAGLALAIASTSGAQTYSTSLLYSLPFQGGLDEPMPSGLDNPIFYGMTAGQTVGDGFDSSDNPHALLWSASGVVDLSPSGYGSAGANAAAGGQQVGTAVNTASGNYEAFLWNGTAASAQDLNPINLGAVGSSATGTNGTQQVGWFSTTSSSLGEATEAVLWNGTAASAVNLNPTSLTGISYSQAIATDGTNQVGTAGAFPGYTIYSHAILWSGTASSAVDLNPSNISGANESSAVGVYGNQEVGYGALSELGDTGNYTHALLWTGTAASAVDLTPSWTVALAGSGNAEALATNGIEQVGWSDVAFEDQVATLWSGTADSAVNLQSLLPAGYEWTSSQAMAIDSSGDIFGYAQSGLRGDPIYAVEWTVVPEPATMSLFLVAASAVLMRRCTISVAEGADRRWQLHRDQFTSGAEI